MDSLLWLAGCVLIFLDVENWIKKVTQNELLIIKIHPLSFYNTRLLIIGWYCQEITLHWNFPCKYVPIRISSLNPYILAARGSSFSEWKWGSRSSVTFPYGKPLLHKNFLRMTSRILSWTFNIIFFPFCGFSIIPSTGLLLSKLPFRSHE